MTSIANCKAYKNDYVSFLFERIIRMDSWNIHWEGWTESSNLWLRSTSLIGSYPIENLHRNKFYLFHLIFLKPNAILFDVRLMKMCSYSVIYLELRKVWKGRLSVIYCISALFIIKICCAFSFSWVRTLQWFQIIIFFF